MRTLALLLIASSLNAAPFLVSPERPVGALSFQARDSASGYHVASNGETTIACWSDHRSGPGLDVFAVRLDRDGSPVGDLMPILMGESYDFNVVYGMVWDGRRFLLVGTTGTSTVWVEALSPDGTTSELTRFYEEDIADVSVAAAPNGGALILFRSGPGYPQLSLRTIDPLSGASRKVLLDRVGLSFADIPRVVRSGDGFTAVWLHDRSIFVQRIDAHGDPIGLAGILETVPYPDYLPPYVTTAAASTGDGALLAYGFDGSVHVLTVARNGSLAPLVTWPGGVVTEIAPAPDGGFIAVEQREDGARLHRFDSRGQFIE